MSLWVIKRVDDGRYVARKGRDGTGSYTKFLQNAEAFKSRELAALELCPENEIVVSVESEMGVS